MRRTPIYKQIAVRKPELLDELLKPERLRLFGNPEMIRTLIRMDHSIQQSLAKRKGWAVCSQTLARNYWRVVTNSCASSFVVLSIRLVSLRSEMR